tara:strand:- start:13022 stop:15235 length:2214 start_codon:yes stop_codon:yes gene_type:complete
MASYSNFDTKNEYGDSVTNYTARDFASIKQNLLGHIQTYFPQAYKDFNETSPGMMLVELSAYVGDVLNYYVDDSFKELLLPLSEDRRNLVNLAKVTGFKPRTSIPSYVDLTFTLTVDSDTSDLTNIVPDSSQKLTLESGAVISSTSNPDVLFETLEPIDFSADTKQEENFVVEDIDATTGLVSTFKATRVIRAISGETKTATFTIGAPEQHKKINLVDLNVIEILSCVDSNGNKWYEVDYLAQENVANVTHYTDDVNRTDSIESTTDGSTIVPSSLSFIKTTKRFITEVNEDNTTSLVFGNGIIKNGKKFETTFIELEQEGVTLPTTNFSPKPLDASIGTYYESLGEAPQSVTLTITYRVGGGVASNVSAADLTTIDTATTIPNGVSIANLAVTNDSPAVGGREGDFTEEIRQGALGNYASQNRCVTKEDFEARTISMPSKFGSIGKVYCTTGGSIDNNEYKQDLSSLKITINTLMNEILETTGGSDFAEKTQEQLQNVNLNSPTLLNLISGTGNSISTDDRDRISTLFDNVLQYSDSVDYNPTIDLYILSYDVNKKLIAAPDLIAQNLKNYLNQFRMLSDKIRILPGYIINFGVVFDVMTFPGYNPSVIKSRCIDAIKQFYSIEKMKFKQILYVADVVNLLNSLEGIKAVNDVVFTQDTNFTDDIVAFSPPLYSKSINESGDVITINDNKHGHLYDFGKFFTIKDSPAGRGVVLPSYDPSVFEIKNPDTDIKGVVR